MIVQRYQKKEEMEEHSDDCSNTIKEKRTENEITEKMKKDAEKYLDLDIALRKEKLVKEHEISSVGLWNIFTIVFAIVGFYSWKLVVHMFQKDWGLLGIIVFLFLFFPCLYYETKTMG